MTTSAPLRTLTVAAAVLIAGLGSAACATDRWCEHDATDTKVDNIYCETGTPGYEWETDSGKTNSKKKRPKH